MQKRRRPNKSPFTDAADYLTERIYEKLNARKRVHAVAIALRRGYVRLYDADPGK